MTLGIPCRTMPVILPKKPPKPPKKTQALGPKTLGLWPYLDLGNIFRYFLHTVTPKSRWGYRTGAY